MPRKTQQRRGVVASWKACFNEAAARCRGKPQVAEGLATAEALLQ